MAELAVAVPGRGLGLEKAVTGPSQRVVSAVVPVPALAAAMGAAEHHIEPLAYRLPPPVRCRLSRQDGSIPRLAA